MTRGAVFQVAVAAAVAGAAVLAQPSGPTVADLERRLGACTRLVRDWAGLTRYGSDNAELAKPAATESRVVFIGDEITEAWGRTGRFFADRTSYVNRGIAGQTTSQMLV